MNEPHDLHGLSAHELARRIQEARDKGDKFEADRLTALFNERMMQAIATPLDEPRAQLAPQPQYEPGSFTTARSVPPDPRIFSPEEERLPTLAELVARDNVPQPPTATSSAAPISELSRLQQNAKSIKMYPESIQPLLLDLLAQFSHDLATPEVVLEPQFLQEFDDLLEEKRKAEPMLQKLPDHIQMRSVLLRYADELRERLK